MSHKSNNRKYVLFQLKKKGINNEFKWVARYYSRRGLIHRIALGELGDLRIFSPILKYLASDMSATECKYNWNNIGKDNYYRTICYREYIPIYYIGRLEKESIKPVSIYNMQTELKLEIERLEKERKHRLKKLEARYKVERYEFRRGPVPNIHKHTHHRGSSYRIPQLGRTRRNAENVEYKEFIKASERYKNLPIYDDRPRHTDKSWKTSCKVRKQWEKHIKKHSDTIKNEKRVYDIEDNESTLDYLDSAS